MEKVTSIDVYCPNLNKVSEEFRLPKNVNIISSYVYDHPISMLELLRVRWQNYDVIVFNILPTGFGQHSITNIMGLMLPIFLNKFFSIKNIKIIYHNSVFTNDFKSLGYNSFYNRIREYFLRKLEKKY